MDRSFAARLGIGGLTERPRGSSRPRARGGGRRAPASHRLGGGVDRALATLWRLPLLPAHAAAAGWARVRPHRRLRIAVIAMLIATPLLAGGWLWLRNSSLVSVERVRVSGLHGSDAPQIAAALEAAGRRMSTLDVDRAALRAAVAAYPVVAGVKASTSFPHGLNIRVSEQPAVATVEVDGAKTAVAADGVVLGEAHVSSSLPTLTATAALTAGERVHGAALLAALAVLGTAPQPLAKDVQSVYSGSKGLTLVLRSNVRAYFRDATRAHAKWASLARVLADSSSAGASYVDVRLPERPAAGFPAGTLPPASNAETERSSTSAAPGSSESSEALAEGLATAVGGGTPSGAQASPASSSSPSATAATGEAESAAATGEPESSAATGETGSSSGGSGESASPESGGR